jgi:hypothetical protein
MIFYFYFNRISNRRITLVTSREGIYHSIEIAMATNIN